MSILTHHNARLTAIKSGGGGEYYGSAGTPGSAKWTGSVDALVYEELVTALEGEELNEVLERRISIPSNLGVVVDSGDTLEYEQDGVAKTGKARNVLPQPMVGTIRVFLADA